MKKLTSLLVGFGALYLVLTASVSAQSGMYTLQPWTYDPGNTGTVVSELDADDALRLEKNTETATEAAAGAAIMGLADMSTDNLSLSYEFDGYCGAGAPRFNVHLTNGTTVFLGCTHGNDGSGIVTFTAGETYGGVLFPEGETIERIDIVMDEEGQTTLSNIMINDEIVEASRKTLQVQCKQNKWKMFSTITFKNQGECVSYFMSSKKAQPSMPQERQQMQLSPTMTQ